MRSQGSQGTPRRALLKVGLMGSLLLPGPAGAATTTRMGAAEFAAEADPEDGAEDGAEEGSSKRKRGSKARGGRSQQVRASVEKAEAQRRPLQDVAQKLLDQDNPEGAASMLANAAEGLQDPVLHLESADAYQRVARKRSGQAAREQWKLSLEQCDKAEAALDAGETAEADRIRVNPGEVETLRAWVSELRDNAKGAMTEVVAAPPPEDLRKKPKRNAKAELIAGSVLLAAGVVGLGVMGGGFYLNKAALREYEKVQDNPSIDTGPLAAQQKQGFAMIGAGAALGVIGVALGVTFVALGVHDLKASRRVEQVRISPTFGGLSISGRF